MMIKRFVCTLVSLSMLLGLSITAAAVPDDAAGLPAMGPPPSQQRPKILYCDPIQLSGYQNMGSYEQPIGCWIGLPEPDITKLPANQIRNNVNNGYNNNRYFEETFKWDTDRGGWVDTTSSSLSLVYPHGGLANLGIPYDLYQKDKFILRYVGHIEPKTTPGAEIAAKHTAKWFISRGMWAYSVDQYTVGEIFPIGMVHIEKGLSLKTIELNDKAALSYMPTLPTKNDTTFEDVKLVLVKQDGSVELIPYTTTKTPQTAK